jgi:hypothetical protein
MSARDILAEYRRARAASAEETAARKARVLRYPDLAEGLTEPPLSFARPDQWNGWIAPRTLAEDACPRCPHCRAPHMARANDSSRREALVLLAAEALRREQELPIA